MNSNPKEGYSIGMGSGSVGGRKHDAGSRKDDEGREQFRSDAVAGDAMSVAPMSVAPKAKTETGAV